MHFGRQTDWDMSLLLQTWGQFFLHSAVVHLWGQKCLRFLIPCFIRFKPFCKQSKMLFYKLCFASWKKLDSHLLTTSGCRSTTSSQMPWSVEDFHIVWPLITFIGMICFGGWNWPRNTKCTAAIFSLGTLYHSRFQPCCTQLTVYWGWKQLQYT